MSAEDRPLVPGSRPTVLEADPAYRRRFFVIYGAAVVVAFLLVAWLTTWGFPMLDEHLRRIGDKAGLRLLKTLLMSSMVVPLATSVYLFRLGRRIQVSEQMPPPGARVIRDTVVVQGPRARRIGKVIVGMSFVSALAAVLAAASFARL